MAKLKVDHVIDAKKLKEKINKKHKEEMKITEEVKEEYYDDEEQIDVIDNLLNDIKSQVIQDDSIEMEEPEKIKEENVRLPSGITLKRVGVETKIKDTNQEEITKASTPAVDYQSLKFESTNQLVKKDAAYIVEKFNTVNSGLKISLTSVQ